eukprot:CAMPEP_0202858004 /NCGR_PEP_ID=MMETSP1391-20130828/714_1 /ASSEMBLY_ACC=CAM_ASM_000867 /TAXON_ID=1034604 /ORGANISM="Chlamydomonas leiostraca, Strain SAG 11-49" /LENGTH=800 /DNA_ID=CAMNT_0049536869 /DNA_START=238 /DNA_END=2641 /DNA_ORIENTATION=-
MGAGGGSGANLAVAGAVLGIFFQVQANQGGILTGGLLGAIVGLMLFVDGLRICVMPLGELVGKTLPEKYPLPVVLLVAFGLGILVTYAEPAISALRPLAELVDKRRAPYLYYVLNDQQEILVLCIGLGVGAAAVLGTLRFVKGWSLKPLIACTLLPNIACSCWMQWGNPDLKPLIGLAWDCGGVTTGPVTVPILLAVGIGVMTSVRQKRLAEAVLAKAVATNTGQALEGFGIVTLASLLPILAVQLMSIVFGAIHDKEAIINAAGKQGSNKPEDQSPLKEVVFAIRAILPLNAALILLVLFVCRIPMPILSVFTIPKPGKRTKPEDSVPGGSEDNSPNTGSHPEELEPSNTGKGIAAASNDPQSVVSADQPSLDSASQSTLGAISKPPLPASASGPVGEAAEGEQGQEQEELHEPHGAAASRPSDSTENTLAVAGATVTGTEAAVPTTAAVVALTVLEDEEDEEAPTTRWGRFCAWDHWPLAIGILMCLGGMILFNLGLTYGFTALGDQAGTMLPAAYLEVPGIPRSPYYGYVGGIFLVEVIVFVLGILATRAEPALLVLGRTVEHLSGGQFTASMLVWAVAFGVGVGMAVGATKILFGVPVVAIILIKYAIASTITCFSSEDFTNIAWDSAGVTTGPVTVPFVLALGIGFSKATGAAEGFGILTAASVAPIISVLATNLLRKHVARVGRSASVALKSGSQRVSKSLNRLSRKSKKDNSRLDVSSVTSHGGGALETASTSGPPVVAVDSIKDDAEMVGEYALHAAYKDALQDTLQGQMLQREGRTLAEDDIKERVICQPR